MARGGSLYQIYLVVADNRCCAPFFIVQGAIIKKKEGGTKGQKMPKAGVQREVLIWKVKRPKRISNQS